MPLTDFAGRRVGILGTGREGRAAWRYLRALHPGLPLTLIDERPPEPGFASALAQHDHLVEGPLSEARLEDFDILVRSPGISPYRDCLQNAIAAGVTVTTPSNLWFEAHRGERTVCITGTKGKSTTSALLAHVLAGCGHRVRLAGNIGKPLLDCDDRAVDWWVIELSSYQLADLQAEPTLAVILNLSPEHLDWHGGADTYRRDKLRLAALAGDRPLILNASDRLLQAAFAERGNTRWFNIANGFRAAGRLLYDGDRELPLQLPAGLPGSHNLSNIAAVMTVTREIGLPLAPVMESVACFRPLPHRLQLLGERAGLRFVNDSISSTPVATVAALESFDAEALTVIVGGLDRGLDWAPYADAFAARSLRAVIGVPDSGPRIVETLRDAGICPPGGLHLAQDLGAAVALAREISSPGAVVLLSPGAPSFPRFRDYRDRGRQFAGWCGLDFEDSDPF